MKKIVFVVSNPFFMKIHFCIFKKLKRIGYNIDVITNSRIIEKYYRKNSISVKRIKINKKIDSNKFKESINRNNFKFNDYCFRELEIYRKKKKHLEKVVYSYLNFLENYFKENKVYALVNSGEYLINIVSWSYAKSNNINFIQNNWCGFIPGNFNLGWNIRKTQWIKKEFLKEKISKKDLHIIEDYITNFKKKKSVLGYGIIRLISFEKLLKLFYYFWYYIFMGKSREEMWGPLSIIKFKLYTLIKKRIAKKYYSEINTKKNYVFFPLHLHYDSCVLIDAIKFYDQLKWVKLISKALPEGYCLYIKEHPVETGTMPIKWIKNMYNLPKVKILKPSINAHDLIKNAKAVAVISSSVGWETIIYDKPLVVLGDPFFKLDGLTLNMEDEKDLPRLLKKAINTKRMDKQKKYQLIYSMIKSHHKGSYVKESSIEFDYRESNIKNIAKGIDNEIRYITYLKF